MEPGQEIFLATSSKSGNPRVIVVMSCGFYKKKLLIGACQMKTTLENIRKNKKVSIVAKRGGEYYRIDDRAKVYSSGDYLSLAIKRSVPPLPHHALAIDLEEIFDLDKQKKIL